MQIALLFLALFNTAQAAEWTGFQGCGIYLAKGVVRMIDHAPVMVINEKSKSEITLRVPIKDEPKLSAYVDMPFEAEVELNKPMDGSKGQGLVKTVKSRLPNPLNPMDTGIRFVKKSECKK